jgi:transcriptional regulator with PAS, ATPase and Fis domain
LDTLHEPSAVQWTGRVHESLICTTEGGILTFHPTDEIGDMPLHTQSKILRLLQEKRFERLGGTLRQM